MSHQVVKVKRGALIPCMTCPICHKLLREATTVAECLHTFCRKCIYKKLSDEEMESCPVCNIDLGCAPLEKLRADHNLQDVRAKIFPYKRLKANAPEIESPVSLPAKRKERSLSSLVVSTPRISTQSGMTGKRSKSIVRKASKGSIFTVEKSNKKGEESDEEHTEDSSSPDMSNKFNQKSRQNYVASDKGKENGPSVPRDLWNPLTCLVEAANRTKSPKFSTRESGAKSTAIVLHDREKKMRNKDRMKKSNVQDEEKNCSDYAPPESERPKKLRKVRQKKAANFNELRVCPQVVLDCGSGKFERRNHPIWLSLVALNDQEGDAASLAQATACYLRIKDGSMPVSFIQKYLTRKLTLTNEDEVEIKCMGQTVIPTLTLNNLVDSWLQTTSTDKVSAVIGSSAKDFVMALGYAIKVPNS